MPRWLFAFLSVLQVGAIFWLSEQPQDTASSVAPGPVGNLLHVPVNAVLAILVLRTLSPRGSLLEPGSWPGLRSRAGWACLAFVFLHGIADETHQFFAGRTCSVFDVLLDACGALLVLLVPLVGASGRPRTWKPVFIVGLLAVSLGLFAWAERPWIDRCLEQLLQSIA